MVQSRLSQSGELIKTLCHHVITFLRERRRADFLCCPDGLLSCSIRERERDIEEQPSYLKLKLVLQLILGLSWAADIIPVCSGGAWTAFPTAISLCECLKALMLRSWLMCRAFCGEVCVGGCVCVCFPASWTKHLFMPDLSISGECGHVCLGSTRRVPLQNCLQ